MNRSVSALHSSDLQKVASADPAAGPSLTLTHRPTVVDLEAQLWREVGQHLELEESVERLFAILAEQAPLYALIFRRHDRERNRLTTIAVGAEPSELRPWPTGNDLDKAQARELAQFVTQNQPTTVDRGQFTLASVLLPEGIAAALVVPLGSEQAGLGLALLALRPGAAVTREQVEQLAPILRPLGVAFENDQRLHQLARLREALEADRAALLSRLSRHDLSEGVIGESGGLAQVMERVAQVAPTEAPVLVLGETGSGKEVIARELHARSRRPKGPVVRVNCGAIPAELIDSELFGHERGSFTGATTTRKGWFERADGGTLFLDEVGELPLAAQVRLLRVLQDGTLERVGGHQTISVDVRIVAATHRHLETMVARGTFREDLWYRLSVFPIRLPALRERMEDLPALAAHFAERSGRRLGGKGLTPTSLDLELLSNYAWPGNVRELAAVIERASILGNGTRLEVRAALGAASIAPSPSGRPPSSTTNHGAAANGAATHQPSSPGQASATGLPPATSADAAAKTRPPVVTLDEAMAQHIRQALEACHGRIEGQFGAAQMLDINPHTLRARMRKLGVEWSQFRSAPAQAPQSQNAD